MGLQLDSGKAVSAPYQLLPTILQSALPTCMVRSNPTRVFVVLRPFRPQKLALRAAKLACDAFPISPDVWCRRVALEARLRGSGAAAAGQLLAVVKESLGCVPAHRAPEMWLQVGDYCMLGGDTLH